MFGYDILISSVPGRQAELPNPNTRGAGSFSKKRMTKAEYAKYLKSDHWKQLRARKMRRKKNCGVCATTENVTVHHLTYRNIYDVETTDLRRMCWRCHSLAHDLMKSRKLRVTSESNHGKWNQTKAAVKKALGLTCVNLFSDMSTPVVGPVRYRALSKQG